MEPTTTESEMMQEESSTMDELTPEEAKASLGLATRLSEELLMSQMAEMPSQTPENAPEGAEEPEMEEMPHMDMEALKKEFREEIKEVVKEEMGALRKEIQDALDEEE